MAALIIAAAVQYTIGGEQYPRYSPPLTRAQNRCLDQVGWNLAPEMDVRTPNSQVDRERINTQEAQGACAR